MKCPKCKIGELVLYKEFDVARQFKISKNGKIYKYPYSDSEHDTEKDYLECKNMACNQYFEYRTNENGLIVKDSVVRIHF